jgi:hypothetical protein
MPELDSTTRIEALLARMTLEEKIGQMTLVSAGQAVTGPGRLVDYMRAIRAGGVGTVTARRLQSRPLAAGSTAGKTATGGAGQERGRRGTAPSDRRRKCRTRE